MLPSLGQWIARSGEVPKGKFLKGISSPGGLRIIAIEARDGWLWPVPSVPGAPRAPSSAGTGQSCQFDIRQQWRLFFISPDSSSHRCCIKFVTYLHEEMGIAQGTGLVVQEDLVLNPGSAIVQLGNFGQINLFASVFSCLSFFKSENEGTYLTGSCLGLIGSTYV